MRKFTVLLFVFILSCNTCFGWGFKKDTQNNEGKGYVGTLPDISKSFNVNEPKQLNHSLRNQKTLIPQKK